MPETDEWKTRPSTKDLLKEVTERATGYPVRRLDEIQGQRYTYPVTFFSGEIATVENVYRCSDSDSVVLSFDLNGKRYCATFSKSGLKTFNRVRFSRKPVPRWFQDSNLDG